MVSKEVFIDRRGRGSGLIGPKDRWPRFWRWMYADEELAKKEWMKRVLEAFTIEVPGDRLVIDKNHGGPLVDPDLVPEAVIYAIEYLKTSGLSQAELFRLVEDARFLPRGGICPSCERLANNSSRVVSNDMARTVLLLLQAENNENHPYEEHDGKKWYELRRLYNYTDAPKVSSDTSDLAAFWPNMVETWSQGYYRLLGNGRAWARGEIVIPRAVYFKIKHERIPLGFDAKHISVVEALSVFFEFESLEIPPKLVGPLRAHNQRLLEEGRG